MKRVLLIVLFLTHGFGAGFALADEPGPPDGTLLMDETDVVPPADRTGTPPQVLRGSAIAMRTAPPEEMDGARWTMAAGERLWFADPQAGEVVACRLFDTSTVGRRVVRCFAGDLPPTLAD